MTLTVRVARNTVIQIMGKIISTILGLIAIAIIARYLGQTGFGQYTTIVTFLSFFAITADLGLTLITAQMISRPGIDQNKVLSNLFGLRLVSAIILLALAPLVIFFFPYEPIIKLGASVAVFSFLFVALNQVFVGVFQKNLRMDKVSLAEIFGRLILLAGLLIVVRFNCGLIGIMAVSVASGLVNFLSHYFFSKKFARIKIGYDTAVWREIIKKSWPLALTIIFNLIYLKTDTLILSLIKSQAEVGIYGAAYRVIDVLITIPFMFAGVVLPIMAAAWAEKNTEQFKNVFQRSFDFMAILAMPLFFGAQIIAKPIMVLVAGEDFGPSGAALKILILAASIIFLGSMFSHGIIAIDRQKKLIGAYIFVAVISVIGYLIFIPRYSYFGAAWVTIWSELAIASASAYFIWKYTDFFPNLKIFLKALAASLIMVLAIYFFKNNLFLTVTSAFFIYFGALYLLKGISREDIVKLFKR